MYNKAKGNAKEMFRGWCGFAQKGLTDRKAALPPGLLGGG